MAIDENKQKALAAALGQLRNNLVKAPSCARVKTVPWMWKPSLPVRFHWISRGAGGLPMGRIVEIYGPESSGKTTLTLQVIAAAQREGKTCAFIDAEHALDPIYARKLGVDIDITCCAPSRTLASRHWKSVTPRHVLAQ